MAWLWGICRGYGRMAGLWGSAKTYGKCVTRVVVWGRREKPMGRRPMSGAFELHGEPRKRMGNVTGYGKRRRYMERPPGRMGSQNHAKTRIWELVRHVDFADFNEFLVGTAALSGRPLKCMGIGRTWQRMSRLMRPAGSGFLAISGAALGYGRWLRPQRPRRRALWRRPCRQSGCLEFLSELPSGGLHPACACRRVPPREAAETHPCTALPRRAAHALGSSTGRRSSPSGRRSWGRGRGMPVCRSSGIRTWGTPFSCQQPSTMLRDPLHITHASRHGACGSGYPACVRTCARAAACGDRQSNAASPFQAPRTSRTWPRCVPESNWSSPRLIWLHGSGRSPGASGIPATDALSPQLALKAPLSPRPARLHGRRALALRAPALFSHRYPSGSSLETIGSLAGKNAPVPLLLVRTGS